MRADGICSRAAVEKPQKQHFQDVKFPSKLRTDLLSTISEITQSVTDISLTQFENVAYSPECLSAGDLFGRRERALGTED